MRAWTAFIGVMALACAAQAAVDVDALWNFGDPAASETRMRQVLSTAQGDDALILRTQIARTLGLRGRFDEAHRELDDVEPLLAGAGPEPRVRARLERGRVLRSSGKPAAGRPLFLSAFEMAQAAGLQNLAADALHMVALVEPTAEGALAWNRRTLDYARRASDARARSWEGPVLNNIGDSLRRAGRLDESLAAFRESREAYARLGRAGAERIARWQVANVLRLQGSIDEALVMQLDLERDHAGLGSSDPYVFEELALLYAAKGDETRAAAYRDKRRTGH